MGGNDTNFGHMMSSPLQHLMHATGDTAGNSGEEVNKHLKSAMSNRCDGNKFDCEERL